MLLIENVHRQTILGDLWKAMVEATTFHMRRVLNPKRNGTSEDLTTVPRQIETVLNSRRSATFDMHVSSRGPFR